jgi:hypothetical protein
VVGQGGMWEPTHCSAAVPGEVTADWMKKKRKQKKKAAKKKRKKKNSFLAFFFFFVLWILLITASLHLVSTQVICGACTPFT